MRRTLKILTLVLMVSMLGACSTFGVGEKQITIGGKSFTEQFLLSKMTVLLLEEEGFSIDELNNLGSSVIRRALINEQIDMMWEYTGTALVTYMEKEPISDPIKAFQRVKQLDQKRDIVWTNMSQVNNTYALIMKSEQAEKLGIKTISDLAEYVRNHPGELTMATEDRKSVV